MSMLRVLMLCAGLGACSNAIGSEDRGFSAEPDAAPVVETGDLVINEIAADGKPDDWVELYNGTEQPIVLARYRLSNDLASSGAEQPFPPDSVVMPGSYVVHFLDGDFGMELEDAGELALLSSEGLIVDHVTWRDGDSPKDLSFGRLPDVTGPFVTFEDISRGFPNDES